MPPFASSAAIDTGNDATVIGIATDQLGLPRVVGQHVDIGAVEIQNSYLVTSAADSRPGSLRQTAALADMGATLTFSSNLAGQSILLTSGSIPIPTTLAIDASSLSVGMQIDGNHASRIFHLVTGVRLSLNSLILTNGYSADGGAIYAPYDDLIMDNCSVVGNSAPNGDGGTIHCSGSYLAFNQCTLSENSALNGSGGALFIQSPFADMNLSECTLAGNSAHGTG